MKKRTPPPFRGISTNGPYFDTNSPFAPPAALSNMLTFDATKDLPRMGSRPGVSEFFFGSWGGGTPIRGCGVVARGKSPSGYALGVRTDLPNSNGSGHIQGAVTGNVFRLDSTWGLTKYAYENVAAGGGFFENDGITAESGPTHVPVSFVCVSPDQTRIIVAENYDDGSANSVARVTCRDSETLAVIWSKKLIESGLDRYVSSVCANNEWVFVATNHFVRVFRLSSGANPANGNSAYGLNGWSSVCKDVKVSADGNSLYALFLGTSLGATLGSGAVVTAGIYAQHFRSGVMKFTISTVAQVAASGSAQTLTQAVYSPQIGPANRYYEQGTAPTTSFRHNYLRFSEQMPWGPRGLLPVRMAIRPQGGIVVAHANAAWGPNGTVGNADYRAPDGSAGRWNVTAFRDNGTVEWIADGDSIYTEDGGAGFFNDLLNTTAKDIAVDSAGSVIIAGRRSKPIGTDEGFTTFKFDSNGDFLAEQDLSGTVHTVCVMPSSQLIVCGSARTNTWEGAGGFAQLFQLDNSDLTIRRHHPDLGSGVDVNGVVGIGFNGPVPDGTDRDTLVFVSDWF